jgi:predicted HicB family RNase H-like nuclease
MTSSKTTVLGIRLDQERRGWIEAEAARQGLSIRAYFERMIDEARSVDQDLAAPAEAVAAESVHGVDPEAMASSKTTVLGLRLDHERREWIEAEAARQGVSIRAYFERLIDEDRFASEDSAELADAMAWESFLDAAPEVHDYTAADTETGAWSADEAVRRPEPPPATPAESATEPTGLCDDLVSLVTISGRVFRDVIGLPFALVDVATRPFRRNRAR